MKKLITETLKKQFDIFDKDLSILIQGLTSFKKEMEKEGYLSVWFEYYQYYDDSSVDVMGKRYETDKEYQDRLKEEKRVAERNKKTKEKREASERATLEKLKKKYESNFNPSNILH